MRKGFQKLAAEMLVEATQPNKDPTIITVDDSGNETKFIVDPENSTAIVQAIDAVGYSPAEKIQNLDPNLAAKHREITDWLESCFKTSDKSGAQLKRAKRIFDREFLRNPNCVSLFGSLSGSPLTPGKVYPYTDSIIVELASFIPYFRNRSLTTGEGEYALAFLFGVTPQQAANIDLVVGNREYTVKNNDKSLDEFVYHMSSGKRDLAKDTSLTKAQMAAKILGLDMPTRSRTFGTTDEQPQFRTRWAIVCQIEGKSSFKFKAFSISNRLQSLHTEELLAKKENRPAVSNKIIITQSTLKVKLTESVARQSIISELSRRDQQDVEAIARRIAQEVLEDELGDDFDKAVRREMIASLKDKEVESGVADVSRDFMRKFYRSLGTASSSPLDKVKV